VHARDPGRPDLLFRPVDELAALVRDGELSARELVEASLERIDALNPALNAFVDVFHDEALAAAGAVGPGDERPFAGVPIAIKNNPRVRGQAADVRADFIRRLPAPYDHNVVRRLRAAGFIVVGDDDAPRVGHPAVDETRRFGPTRNPWDPERTPGGSSGGSAAAVASGMVPIAHANDGGGSIRIPAALLRPGWAQAPARPHLAGARRRRRVPRRRRRRLAHRARDAAVLDSWPGRSWATPGGPPSPPSRSPAWRSARRRACGSR
jgi:Asp-tRNA(Asn)/Glu-tRNA(Gln) amidotransferase A subunit family amidase